VPENKAVPQERGRPLTDGVTVFIDGSKAFNGWESVKIEKNLDSIAHRFSMVIDDRFLETGEQWPLKPGVGVSVSIGDERVITGRIEKIDLGYSSGDRSYTVSGRSKAGDLVDSSHLGDAEYNNIGLDKLAETLVAPFGLKVLLSVTPKVIEKFAVKPGESVFDALDRAARTQGFLWVSTRAGNIRLTKAARARATSELHEDVNIKSASASFDDSQRYDQYVVRGQRAGNDELFGLNASGAEGKSFDRGISRYRPLVVIAEGAVDSDKAATRAGWEASNRIAKALQVSVQVQGWRQEDNSLWGLNQVVRLRSKILGLNRDLLTSSVSHSQSIGGGTTTDLMLVRPDSFDSKPEFKAADDPILNLGPGF
jgi:prophage tail gpP-like protein